MGIQLSEQELTEIRSVTEKALQKNNADREKLLPILQEVQHNLGYVPKQAMQQISEALDIPEVEIYGVTTFYNQFRLNPPGKHQIKVCMGTACHMTGGHIIMDSFARRLNIKEGETTPDREFSLERVACVGCCALAPVVVIDEKIEGKVRPTRVDGILLGFEMEKKSQEKQKQEETGESQ
ncbi:NADH dehydrogenase (ubiquinone) 24 kDa subunit [Thermincola ferriacetica]|uniref:NADH dehydrogenase (Ubiquinone) 24 kDa subunit n=1 Tax=Thermincola ferriacetica TaxID=281456 RepID=A0A0L6W2G7_9FIRM|nr:NADH-quinone oxidoreductase subunit NuoE [Thermincola ferriacetica]KNZ69274.1 NADH dehydrogenase (ubiquinone) 24 kDa subunit [Thermincola ferriacetica]